MWSANSYLSVYDRHKKLINDYLLLKGTNINSLTRDTSRDKTDHDVIREHHKFLWDETEDVSENWKTRLAKKYYDRLFKEYCLCDLSYYKYNKIALRWRTEKEVIIGKGQFQCGSKKCNVTEDLRTWEVNFSYTENNEKKNALVKLRLCTDCSIKLNYRSKKREIKRHKSLKHLQRNTNMHKAESTESEKTANKEKTIDNVDLKTSEENSSNKPETTEDESLVWKTNQEIVEKSREEEFEEYLEDLFL